MSSEAGTITTRKCCHGVSLCRSREFSFPVDFYQEMPIDRFAIRARAAYLVETGDPESVRHLSYGRHPVRGGRQIVVLESHDRFFLAPADDCVLDYSAGEAQLADAGPGTGRVLAGVKKMPRQAIVTGPGTDALFRAVSCICSLPGGTSPYRSHPLCRMIPPDIRLSSEGSHLPAGSRDSPISLRLPPDLRYLYAAAPLAYYLGAAVETGDGPCLEASGRTIDLPAGYGQFERWAGEMLSHTFQADCAVRCETVTGNKLPGIDVRAITGYAPEELMLMAMSDRFLLYAMTLRSSRRAFHTWHMASYVEPVPSSVEILPFLMRSLSAVYATKSTPLSERDVVSLSVRNFKAHRADRIRGDGEQAGIVLPSLHPAQTQHWYSGGCPVDATLSSIGALKKAQEYTRDRRVPEICVIGNEQPMAREAHILKDLLDGIAHVEVRLDVSRDDLLHAFSEGFDIVHYAGHCDRRGLQCRDGPVDLSSVGTCDVPVFFLNSCSSYLQGARLIEKGAVCGIATMYRLLDEAALDVCTSFYRMLARGYPIMSAYLGARECSVTGKEYLLIGDGFYKVFNRGDSLRLFYKLSRNHLGFTVQCTMPGRDKGLIVHACNGQALIDTGFEVTGLQAEDLSLPDEGLDGMCLYGSGLYDCVGDAVRVALIDLKHSFTFSRVNVDASTCRVCKP